MITIIDYGMGNLRSVQKAIEAVGHSARITSDPAEIQSATKVILPGVGAFSDAIAVLRETGLGTAFIEAVRMGKPCLGVCLGLQLLFEQSEEDGIHQGLGLLPGKVIPFQPAPGLKIPHMGWNQLHFRQEHPLLKGIEDRCSVYFVHSYFAQVPDNSIVVAEANYPGPFPAIVARGNLVACQFHPEKSQAIGLAMYRNFAAMEALIPSQLTLGVSA